jgi:hypothetical protein
VSLGSGPGVQVRARPAKLAGHTLPPSLARSPAAARSPVLTAPHRARRAAASCRSCRTGPRAAEPCVLRCRAVRLARCVLSAGSRAESVPITHGGCVVFKRKKPKCAHFFSFLPHPASSPHIAQSSAGTVPVGSSYLGPLGDYRPPAPTGHRSPAEGPEQARNFGGGRRLSSASFW